MPSLSEEERAYEALKREITSLGFARPGSLVTRMVSCGNLSCRCAGDVSARHGPYYQWTTKVRGKTRTLRLTPDQARQCARWIENHRKLKSLLQRMEEISLRETNQLLGIE
jgi:hypothetical protein